MAQLQSREFLGPPETGTDMEEALHRTFRVTMALVVPWFWTSSLRTVREQLEQ